MSAPEKIWVPQKSPEMEYATRRQRHWGKDQLEYHLARDGQPCSTDEFLARLTADKWSGPYAIQASIKEWLSGDFAAAMEGLE